MDSILFIANYPDEQTIKEGMAQRIKNIDNIFKDINRTYLEISFRRNFKKSISKKDDNLIIIKLNYFLHRNEINRIMKLNIGFIYFHSLYNYIKVIRNMGKLKRINRSKLILDIHGIVPEELKYCEKYLQSFIYEKVEKNAINNIDNLIFVSNAMRNHFSNKYKRMPNNKNITYLTFNNNVINSKMNLDLNYFKKSLGISEKDTVFIYSGNIQKWQNIELMIKTILSNDKYKFILLTNEIVGFKNLIEKYSLDMKRIILKKSNIRSNLWLMQFFNNIYVSGIACAVPTRVEKTIDLDFRKSAMKYFKLTWPSLFINYKE